MRAVLFRPKDGAITVGDVPMPQPAAGQLLVRNEYSLISAGTERARLETGQESLIGKARRRPDQVKQVLDTARSVGPAETWRIVSDRLSSPMLTGYSSAGIVVEVGPNVGDIRPGDLVACAGAGYANHAEYVVVPRNLCVRAPAGVSARDACFGTVGAIALQGIHQAATEAGSRVVVIGLGLVGQLTMQLLMAYGYDALGIDQDEAMVELARKTGACSLARSEAQLPARVEQALGGPPDAVLITAGTKSTDPIELAGLLARDRGRVVVVGDVTVALPRASYYGKELTVSYSRSYGPGRYDPMYEEGGIEYPSGYVPWDERRNLSEVLRLIGAGRLDLGLLDPEAVDVADAERAFSLLGATGAGRKVAILISYGQGAPSVLRGSADTVDLTSTDSPARSTEQSTVRLGAIGVGSFATRMLLPHLKADPKVSFSFIASNSGVSAVHQGKRWGFAKASSDLAEGLAASESDAVMVLTRHDSHARYVVDVLERGLSVFCEKPLALSEGELDEVAGAWLQSGKAAMVGFNRRCAPSVRLVAAGLARRKTPVQIVCRVFGGQLPPDYWSLQPDQGGRILGEVCHFVDLANFLVGAPPVAVTAHAPDGTDPIRAESVSALLSYQDGSSASIIYSGESPRGAPKELIELATLGMAARIDDFRSLSIWGNHATTKRWRGGSKGHREEMAAFVQLVGGLATPESDFRMSLWSTLATLRLARSVVTGDAVEIAPSSERLAAALGVSVSPEPASEPSEAREEPAGT
ncbi:MAG: bi-domain-containing oxidoreductase [Acidimicrobiales bacterium]|jgi:predicted dehydrogenase/NADPH:quinone reductase-like Zn-dependent oxidoreductase